MSQIRSQLLKGLLDGFILAVIEEEAVYGYELSQKLKQAGLDYISEGTIYPVLLRLQNNNLIKGEMRPSDSGPNRKYYFLTTAGERMLQTIVEEWEKLEPPINLLLKGKKEWQ